LRPHALAYKNDEDNDAYVNAHTIQNPKGEIRGQILSVSS